jgi:hypothetical protein
VNEMLYRGLLHAQFSGEDVATILQVDPKTVRCWLDGRVPYPRHRWALARLVGMDEADLWPQLRSSRSRPGEVVAVYPHRDSVPSEDWLGLFAEGRRDVGVLADSRFLLAAAPALPAVFASLASAGACVRICLAGPAALDAQEPGRERPAALPLAAAAREVFVSADLRIHDAKAYCTMCYADDDFMVAQHLYGIPDGQVPVVRLRRSAEGDLASSYRGSFERIWAGARSLA